MHQGGPVKMGKVERNTNKLCIYSTWIRQEHRMQIREETKTLKEVGKGGR